MDHQAETLETLKNIDNNETKINNTLVNTSSNNKYKPYNKKELMKLSKQERINIVFGQMQNNIQQNANNPDKPKTHNIKSYLYNDDNKAFHLEIIKRSFKR